MPACTQCGAPYDPSSSFCRGCGSALPVPPPPAVSASPAVSALPPPPAAVAANPPSPVVTQAPRSTGRKVLKIVGITVAVFFALFIGLAILGAILGGGKNGAGNNRAGNSNKDNSANGAATTPSDQKASKPGQNNEPWAQPTAEQLAKVQGSDLSKEFATSAWRVQSLIANAYGSRMLGLNVREGMVLPSDEVMRDDLKASKSSIRNAADQRAYDQLHALLWLLHVGPNFKTNDPRDYRYTIYRPFFDAAGDCASAMFTNFSGNTVTPGVGRCLSEQVKLKNTLDKVKVHNWDDF